MNETRKRVCLAATLLFTLATPARAEMATGAASNSTAPAAASKPRQPLGAGLLVAPTRVTFDNHHRTAALTVVNNGAEAATYRISFIQTRMDEKGQIQQLPATEVALNPADELVRFSPRQVYLEPNASQTIRLQVRKPANLADGEYRSHLVLRVLPNTEPAATAPPPDDGSGALRIQLTMLYGVSIPVIVRQGELWSKVELQGMTYIPPKSKNDPPQLSVQMNRTGNESAYGDLTAILVDKRGHEVSIGAINGLAVYTPNAKRTVQMTLTPPPGVDLKAGRIHLSYAKPNQKTAVLASGYVDLP